MQILIEIFEGRVQAFRCDGVRRRDEPRSVVHTTQGRFCHRCCRRCLRQFQQYLRQFLPYLMPYSINYSCRSLFVPLSYYAVFLFCHVPVMQYFGFIVAIRCAIILSHNIFVMRYLYLCRSIQSTAQNML